MRKISYLIITLIAFIVLIPGVNAKEINITNWNEDTTYDVEEGDVLIYDVMDRKNDSLVLGMVIINNDTMEPTDSTSSSPAYRYTVISYEKATGEKIPAGKKISIKASIFPFCEEYMNLYINYNLIDDTKKKVIYNNTFDALNDNPENYYEGEADILLKDIKREGYKFLGWYKTSDYKENSRVTIIDNDAPETLELYAKWEKIESQVKKDNIEENPNTYTTTYVIAGIFSILILSTIVVYVYGKKQKIK